jgi:hypothetical protein
MGEPGRALQRWGPGVTPGARRFAGGPTLCPEVRVTRRSQPGREPPLQIGRRGPRGSWDPFYAFEKIARDDGKPYKSPEPKAQQALVALLSGKAALLVMSSVLVLVIGTLLVLLVLRA